ncbi:MAG: hypothetical protein DWQ35_19530 [Planctomycetota bacterium]|nr:MAG: hypothetical protein DWQ35_19530 [Planctomycetota bacterium]REK23959.1 MAG: hypothetical protein DWQ42_14025 [Planctomycetota bacterium]REK49093.1 MAG: hypothetical protein DWQ46_00890 [Planctomycetota bacterium]
MKRLTKKHGSTRERPNRMRQSELEFLTHHLGPPWARRKNSRGRSPHERRPARDFGSPSNQPIHLQLGRLSSMPRLARWLPFALPLTLLLASAQAVVADHHATKGQRPNVVLILADDMGIGDVGIYNPDSKIPTPHMDRLARAGIRMTDMHTPSAVCTPTRYGLLTGRYCWRTRLKQSVLFGYDLPLIEEERMTLASLLRKHGYATAVFGKWHLGLGVPDENGKTDYSKPLSPGPLSVGFDRFYGIPASLDMAPYVYVDDTRVVEAATDSEPDGNYIRWGGTGYIVGGPRAPSFRHVDVLPVTFDKTVEYIESQTAERPFFVYVPLSAPHTPWAPTKEFKGQSQAGVYGDFTAMVDHGIGRILQAIDEGGFADNTLVIVTSDNGSHWLPMDIEKYGHHGNLHYRGQKADIHDGGHRVPFIARWPGKFEAGKVSDQLGCLTDMLATVAAIVGEPLPHDAGEDSFNLLPAWQKGEAVREAIVHHSGRGMFAIRRGEWKLIFGLGTSGFTEPWGWVEPEPGGPRGQLYNMADDVSETTNVWLEHPEVVAELTRLMHEYRETGCSR